MQPPAQSGDGRIRSTDFLRKDAEFAFVKENGRSVAGKYIVLARVPAPDGNTRLGIVVGKRCCRLAVGRNRGRRLIRESFRLSRHSLPPGVWLVAIARHPIVQSKVQDVQAEMHRLFARLTPADPQ